MGTDSGMITVVEQNDAVGAGSGMIAVVIAIFVFILVIFLYKNKRTKNHYHYTEKDRDMIDLIHELSVIYDNIDQFMKK